MTNHAKSTSDLFTRIRKLGKMTRSENKIASFFSNNINRLAFENLTALSQKAQVSKASMVRFIIHRLGYRDFSEFQTERQEQIENRLESPVRRYIRYREKIHNLKDGKLSAMDMHIPSVLNHIQQAYEHVDSSKLSAAAALLANDESSIYLLSQRTSFSLSFMLYANLQYVRPKVFLLGSHDSSFPQEAFSICPGDTVFVIHRRRYSINTYNIVKHLKNPGINLILATDAELTPLSSLADIQITIPPSKTKEFYSVCAWVAVLESLFLSVAELRKEHKKEYSNKVEQVLQKYSINDDEEN